MRTQRDLVNAATSLMPQTREHVRRVMGVPILVALGNKADAVDDEELPRTVEMEVRELLAAQPETRRPVSALKAPEGDARRLPLSSN